MEDPSINPEGDEKPRVLVLKAPPAFTILGFDSLNKFELLKAFESPIPLDQYLTAHGRSIQAVLISGSFPATAETLRLLPSLRVIVTSSTGLNHIDLAECRRRGIAIANAGTSYTEDVADAAVGLLIGVLRKVAAADLFVRKGLWPVHGCYPLGSKLGGKRVGIVGLGNIGSEVAKRLEAFGCKILYNSRKKKPTVPYPFYSNVHELAIDSDILIICCGLTEETHHMINKEVMAALGKDGVIVNIGRGPIIDEKELVRCLLQGEVAGAGLDVFEHEPKVPEELFGLDNVVLSPHKAVCTYESYAAMCELARANLEAFFSNKPLVSPVALE